LLSSIFLVMTLSGPLHEGHTQIRTPYTVNPMRGDVQPKPPRASAPAKPVVIVEAPKPSPYSVEPSGGFTPVRLPKGYPKDLEWQFPKNYRRDDQ
jgi:hypothetical protein